MDELTKIEGEDGLFEIKKIKVFYEICLGETVGIIKDLNKNKVIVKKV